MCNKFFRCRRFSLFAYFSRDRRLVLIHRLNAGISAPVLRLLSILILATFPACSVRPTIKSGETVVTLGGSIFSKSDNETASYSGPLGNLSYASVRHDETVVPAKAINSYTTIGLAKEVTKAFDTGEATKVKLGEQSVSKNATNKAAASADLKTLNPVEVIPAAP